MVMNLAGDMKMKITSLMKLHLLVCFLMAIANISCSDSPSHPMQHQEAVENSKSRKMKPAGSYPDTIKINFPSAVFYSPDSLQLEKIKAITESMIFESTMHDCFYQMRNSRNVLKQYYTRVQTIEVKNARYICFEKKDGEKDYFDLNANNDPCGVVIFDGRKSPKLVDMTNIETELGFYFTK